MAFVIRSLVTSALQLKRDRPPSHAGKLYRVEPGEAKLYRVEPGEAKLYRVDGRSAEGEAKGEGGIAVVAPVPPCYDEELAGLLRSACMVFSRVGAECSFPVLVGSTLANWYHLGSQVPWKQQIHLAVVVTGWRGGSGADAAALATSEMRRLASVQRASFHEEDGVLEWSVRGRREDRPEVLVVCRLQVSPYSAAELPLVRDGLRRVAIDGGNTGVFVFASPREMTAALREVGKDAAARLDLPRGWYWSAEDKSFVKPGLVMRALQWPPNVTTAKAVGAVAVLLLVWYALTMMALPEWGDALARRRREAKWAGAGQGAKLAEVGLEGCRARRATASAGLPEPEGRRAIERGRAVKS
jgi:hypothetical protein